MTVALSVAIQHHPSRADLIPALLERLAGLTVEVVADPEPDATPSPWRTYRACLEQTPAWATHRVILQDDVVPAPGFASALTAAVTARPDKPVALWLGGSPMDACVAMKQASKAGRRWIDLSPYSWFPCVAAVWPAAVARDVLAWAAANKIEGDRHRADDGILARYFRARRLWPLATVPSLVSHPDVVESVIGRRAWRGRQPSRVECLTVPDDVASLTW